MDNQPTLTSEEATPKQMEITAAAICTSAVSKFSNGSGGISKQSTEVVDSQESGAMDLSVHHHSSPPSEAAVGVTVVVKNIESAEGQRSDLPALQQVQQLHSLLPLSVDKNAESVAEGNGHTKAPETSTEEGLSDTESQITEVMDLSIPTMTSKNGHNAEDRRSRGEKRKLVVEDEAFIQDGPCYKVEPRIGIKCRECRDVVSIRNNEDIVCRFASFRKLMYKKTGLVCVGFCDPNTDPRESDLNLWLPRKDNPPEGLELDLCKNLIIQVGDQFCSLICQEKEAEEINRCYPEQSKCWKQMVEGVREMCDVCQTTIFNYHWSCENCGFMVCIDCVKARHKGIIKDKRDYNPAEKDEFNWMLCKNRGSHEVKQLWLTQIIPGEALDIIGGILHRVRWELDIPQLCKCIEATRYSGMEKKSSSAVCSNIKKVELVAPTASPRKKICLETGAKNQADACDIETDSDSDEEGIRMLQGMINSETKPTESAKSNGSPVIHQTVQPINQGKAHERAYNDKQRLPVKISGITQSKLIYPDLPHTWLCSGTLLRVLDPSYEGSYDLFKDLWKRGQPIVVSKVAEKLDKNLWSPEAFLKDFGHQRSDLVNCMTGKVVPRQKMSRFWNGFIDYSCRLKDDNGVPMLLKLKDWPPGDDFAKMLPSRFSDLMAALPLKDYTHRTGRLNLAARLPSNFTKPDLGPKMYIAYGDGNHLEKGTTNLHLDISDAVNCMVHVGPPKNCDIEQHNKAVEEAIKDSDCDQVTIERVTKDGELPGALWHIYRPWDADKIRDLLNKVTIENGSSVEANNDPIHDQVAYLDKHLRKRLRDEYDVQGFPIVQCEGDAVFIPAGAPHQVRNLHNCIKIAEDFVSPENVSHCFKLTEEFRNLSETHTNHEDKLQIKNIVYHAVKDALSVLIHAQEKLKIVN